MANEITKVSTLRHERLFGLRWQARIRLLENGVSRNTTIGTFSTAEEASAAYSKAAQKIFGEFARSE